MRYTTIKVISARSLRLTFIAYRFISSVSSDNMSSEPKNDWQRYVIPKLPELVQKLHPSSLLEELLACGLITSEEGNSLRHDCSKEEDRSRKLLYDFLPYKGNDAFNRFCHILRKVEGQQHILTEVLQIEIVTTSSGGEKEKTPQQQSTNESTDEAPALHW